MGWVGHAGVGWGGSCRGEVRWIMQGWSRVGHAGVGWVGHAGVGWEIMQGWVGHAGVGWGGSCRGGVGHAGVG